MYSLGGKIKDLRTKRGLTQDELADQLNAKFGTSINKSMLSKWENNKEEPSLDNGRNLALFFGISLDELLGLNEPSTLAAHHDGDEWSEEELQEIERFKEFIRLKRNHQE